MAQRNEQKKKRRQQRLTRQSEYELRSANQRHSETKGHLAIDAALAQVTTLINQGQGPEAVQLAEALTQSRGEDWRAWNLLATIQSHLRQDLAAEATFRKVTQIAPQQREGWHGLGKMLSNRHANQEAQACLAKAVALGSAEVGLITDLARTFLIAGNLEQAAKHAQLAVSLAPKNPEALNILGLVLQQEDKLEDAAIAFCHAATERENFADALANLAECLRVLGRLEEAEEILTQTLEIEPQHGNALGFMGLLQSSLGEKEKACEFLQQAIDRNPRYRLFRLQLARNQASVGWPALALQNVDHLLLDSDVEQRCELLLEKAGFYSLFADSKNARACCAEVLSHQTGNLRAELKSALAIPQVNLDWDEIHWHRQHLDAALDQVLNRTVPPQNHRMDEFPNAHFYLTYHGLNNCQINQKLSRTFRHVSPEVNYINPQLADLSRLAHPGSKIKLAFVSKNFSNHTIGRLMLGLLGQIDRQKFEVNCFAFAGKQDEYRQKFIASSDNFGLLPADSMKAAEVLSNAQPDLLFYPDIGMDPLTYQLAHCRIAPIQCVTWGHPVTTGISTIDYFLSSEGMDSQASCAHYSEKLVVLKHLFFYYERPPLLSHEITKNLLGLPESFHLYLCPQTLFKYHPEFDAMLAGILRQDANGLILMVKLGNEAWREKLLARFAQTMPDVHQRIVWLPKMSAFKFQHLFRLGDVSLDPYRFGSGNTSLEAFAMGTPIVTCPDQFMRTRVTAACYQRMGVMDAVAETPEDYVEKAVKIAKDRELREHLSRRISDQAEMLFCNKAAVRELENWFESTVQTFAEKAS